MKGQTIDDIPSAIIEDAAQLVKANSIDGNKMNNIDVVYTMWSNLKKTPAMEVGQVSFHKDKDVRKIRVEKRINLIVNRLNKTKREEHPGNNFRRLTKVRIVKRKRERSYHLLNSKNRHLLNTNFVSVDFRAEREKRDAKEREDQKKILREQKEKAKEDEKRRREEAELRSYSSLQNEDKMQSNQDDGNDSDDFM